jgi:C_GCAxxG_C_C family probable redox protein
MSFSPDFNLSDEAAYKIAVHYGAGMKTGNVCGAVTGALMALGLAGKSDEKIAHQVLQKFKENHKGCLNCVDLLRQNKEAGGNKKVHCDACVYECVKLVEELL